MLYYKHKRFDLDTQTISDVMLTVPVTADHIVQTMSILNDSMSTYGLIYFIDSSCRLSEREE